MIYLREVYVKDHAFPEGYPFDTRLMRYFERLEFTSDVTLFIGSNGSGKSTLLEGMANLAECMNFGEGYLATDDETMELSGRLGDYIRLSYGKRPNNRFIMRAEAFGNYISLLKKDKARFEEDLRQEPGTRIALCLASVKRELEELDTASHGEVFLRLFQERIVPGGLYFLDEPETPLSPANQYAFMIHLGEMVRQGCQLIICTHSPIIMAYPGAQIIDFDQTPIRAIAYEQIETVRFMRDFLNNTTTYTRHIGG